MRAGPGLGPEAVWPWGPEAVWPWGPEAVGPSLGHLEGSMSFVMGLCGCGRQSLEMAGFSITLMVLDQDTLEALESPTTAPAWPGVARHVHHRSSTFVTPRPVHAGLGGLEAPAERLADLSESAQLLHSVLRSISHTLIALEPRLSAADAQVRAVLAHARAWRVWARSRAQTRCGHGTVPLDAGWRWRLWPNVQGRRLGHPRAAARPAGPAYVSVEKCTPCWKILARAMLTRCILM